MVEDMIELFNNELIKLRIQNAERFTYEGQVKNLIIKFTIGSVNQNNVWRLLVKITNKSINITGY